MKTPTTLTTAPDAPQIFGTPALDFACDRIEDGDIAPAMDELFEDLCTRRTDESGTWQEYAGGCLNHPLRDLVHQDPFTHRAFAKPRGYAGDAVMMDYIYGLGEAREAAQHATPLGRAIFSYMSSRPSAKGVRYRRELIAKIIDRVASNGRARVLAIAAGHLREAELSVAVQQGQLAEFIAIDQDPASLAVVARDYTRFGIRTREGSVRQILAGKVNLGQFDFVYAAGLFDYLSAPVAAALARRMFEMTKPGGVMLIPNFLGTVRDRGYMESFMNWQLIYRNHADMQALAAALPDGSVAEHRIFDDQDDAITFLVVSKAGATSPIVVEAPLESGAERRAAVAVAELSDGRPSIRVAGRVGRHAHWQSHAEISGHLPLSSGGIRDRSRTRASATPYNLARCRSPPLPVWAHTKSSRRLAKAARLRSRTRC